MATRSRIGIELVNGSVLSVYHHLDGYPEWLGRILKTHYSNRKKVAALIDGGDMSSCWTEMRWTETAAEKVQEYGPEYYSDRGENCPPRHDASLEEYLSEGEEFAYLYRKGEWVCYNMHQFEKKQPELVEIPAGALAV
jgi:hypothetical protein